MKQYTLTLVDVRRVQRYLFNANELKQNLGASALIEHATHAWIFEALPENRNAQWNSGKYEIEFDQQTIEANNLDAEVIFMGGGNAAILFQNDKLAKDFTQQYTRKVLLDAPGLDVAVGHTEVQWKLCGLQEAWDKLRKDVMPRRKNGRSVAQPILGLAVTTECAFTGLPAVHEEEAEEGRGVLMSAEANAKKDNEPEAKKRLTELLPVFNYFEYPSKFDDLGGEKGHARFVAIVHADGNGMGKRAEAVTRDEDNRKMVDKMRSFSEKVNRIGLKAMQAVRDRMTIAPELEDKQNLEDKDHWLIQDTLGGENTIHLSDLGILPLRPIVFGGDDVTFVCDGRVGLALAVEFLEAFSKENIPALNGKEEPAYACAGVAIVHSNYPFARAYALAEELAKEAKKQAVELDPPRDNYLGKNVSLINWHFATSGLGLDWDDIQKREYTTYTGETGDLLLRPLVVEHVAGIVVNEWQTWKTFLKQIQHFRKDWHWGHNKLKELQEELRKGPDAVRQFTNLHTTLLEIPALAGQDTHKSGWYQKRCVYFDALEANDLFIYPKEAKYA